VITDNAITESTFGVYLDKSSENTIWRNDVRGNLIYGMEVAIQSDRNSIRFNTILYSVSEGLLISGSHANRFTDNVVRVGLNYKFDNYYAPVGVYR
jgi:parallel beta-helix repeat protein